MPICLASVSEMISLFRENSCDVRYTTRSENNNTFSYRACGINILSFLCFVLELRRYFYLTTQKKGNGFIDRDYSELLIYLAKYCVSVLVEKGKMFTKF